MIWIRGINEINRLGIEFNMRQCYGYYSRACANYPVFLRVSYPAAWASPNATLRKARLGVNHRDLSREVL